ncbi:MAG: hypothetical protein JWR01_230 [Subtercola sp.]|nr:hypothetical protein [Subtercola sp.]
MSPTPPNIAAALDPGVAIRALEDALLTDIDPETDSPRLFSPLTGGEFLLMPSASARFAGVKVLTIPSGPAAAGHPKIQGVYVLFDARTLAPVAVLDGAELTLSRTSAMTALAVKHMLAAAPGDRVPAALRLVIFGAGPQARRHIAALRSIAELSQVTVVGRSPGPVDDLVEYCRASGLAASAGTTADVADADLVVCVTSATEPLFEGRLVAPHAVVAAVGSHGLDARELDPALVRRADIVVEGRASALRESGDLIPARSVEEWAEHQLTNVAELIRGTFQRRPGHPAVYTGVGMAWQDLVVAGAAHAASGA